MTLNRADIAYARETHRRDQDNADKAAQFREIARNSNSPREIKWATKYAEMYERRGRGK